MDLVGEAFVDVSEHDEPNHVDWRSALQRLGGLNSEVAEELSQQFSSLGMPAPVHELVFALTHEFLMKEVGIKDPIVRVRVIEAIARCPPAPKISFNEGHVGASEAMKIHRSSTLGGGATTIAEFKPPGFHADSERKRVFDIHFARFEWQDIVGKDSADPAKFHATTVVPLQETFAVRQRKYMSRTNDLLAGGAAPTPSGTGPGRDEMLPHFVNREVDEEDDAPLVGKTPRRPGSSRPRAEAWLSGGATGGAGGDSARSCEFVEPFDVFSAPRPLPVFLVSPNDNTFTSFVLRVPTPNVDFSEATISSLTNKWIVVVDRRTVATVHRLDSIGLSRLRAQSSAHETAGALEAARSATLTQTSSFSPRAAPGSPSSGISTIQHLIRMVFVAYLGDFDAVLDECSEVLDDCELKLLDKNAARELIERLVHLQRRAGVYGRLVTLNEALFHRVADHYGIPTEAVEALDVQWQLLKERAVGMESRSQVILNMVLSLSGQRTTDVMTVLTKFSIIISPLTLIVGVYGMNFDVMPELRYEYGYYVVLSVMALIALGMLVMMKAIGL